MNAHRHNTYMFEHVSHSDCVTRGGSHALFAWQLRTRACVGVGQLLWCVHPHPGQPYQHLRHKGWPVLHCDRQHACWHASGRQVCSARLPAARAGGMLQPTVDTYLCVPCWQLLLLLLSHLQQICDCNSTHRLPRFLPRAAASTTTSSMWPTCSACTEEEGRGLAMRTSET